ncbi:MAG: MerR family transcriptional regulator [Deltaproteobacteria bacterium]|jgi:DNA-binding transcriptional MerR regulator|nr:MerR family transcriptional regulator [Deltaproteobacteria bacterium]
MPGKIYKIGEAAQLLGLKSYVLRFWESEFPQLNPTRTESGQRLYSEQDLELLRRIRNLLHERGLTIEGAKKVLSELQYADESLSSDLLDEGYQDFCMAMGPEDEGGEPAAATDQAAQLDGPTLRPQADESAGDAVLREVLAELKELRSLLAAPVKPDHRV